MSGCCQEEEVTFEKNLLNLDLQQSLNRMSKKKGFVCVWFRFTPQERRQEREVFRFSEFGRCFVVVDDEEGIRCV